MKALGVYCAGGFGGVAYELAEVINQRDYRWEQIFFIDDNCKNESFSHKIYTFESFIQSFGKEDAEIVIASGEPRVREKLFIKVKEKEYSLPNLIHPNSEAGKIMSIGEGNIILAYSYFSGAHVTVGNNNIVMPYAQISHDNVIGNHIVIASSATLSGTTNVHDRAYIAVGAKLREGLDIGADAIIGMGAIVVKNVPAESVVTGMPAKEIRKNTGSVFR